MKCQRKASPQRACLASRSCARFSPTTSIPASARAPRSSAARYLVAATIVTSGPSCARIRSWFARTVSGDKPNDALPPGDPFVAAVREEVLGRAGRAEVDPVDPGTARRAQRPLGGAPEVELPVADEAEAVRTAERRRHLLADLVAARADAGPDDRRNEASAERRRSLLGDPAEQAAPASVEHRERGPPAVDTR